MRMLTFPLLILAATLLQAGQSGTAQETTVRGQIVSTDNPPAGIARVAHYAGRRWREDAVIRPLG
jgi:hypothetical protein